MKKFLIPCSFIFSAAVLVACGNNDADDNEDMSSTTVTTDTSSTTMANTVAVGDTDRQFILEAASGGMMEVEAGRLAEQNAANQRVKAFGAMMVRDHSAANEQLRAIAST